MVFERLRKLIRGDPDDERAITPYEKELSSKVSRLESEITTLSGKYQKVKADLNVCNSNIGEYERNLSSANKLNNDYLNVIEELNKTEATLRAEIDKLKATHTKAEAVGHLTILQTRLNILLNGIKQAMTNGNNKAGWDTLTRSYNRAMAETDAPIKPQLWFKNFTYGDEGKTIYAIYSELWARYGMVLSAYLSALATPNSVRGWDYIRRVHSKFFPSRARAELQGLSPSSSGSLTGGY